VDPCSAWTAKANKRVQFGYGLNYLIDIANAIIVDVEPTRAVDAASRGRCNKAEGMPTLTLSVTVDSARFPDR
jgi:hypothetical protein